MKKTIHFLIMFLLFVVATNARTDLYCESIDGLEGLCFDVTFSVSTDKEMKIPSKYNFPYFIRAGDYLYIKNVKIYNLENDTKSEAGEFTLNIRPIDYVDKPYTDLKKIYPLNYGKFIFYVGDLQPNFNCEYDFDIENKIYKTNCGNEEVTLDRFFIELFKEGEWVIVNDFKPYNKSVGHTTIFNGRWKGNTFKVTSGFEMDNFKDLKSSLKWVVIAILITILISIIPVYFSFKNLSKNKQKENKFLLYAYIVLVGGIILLVTIYALIEFT